MVTGTKVNHPDKANPQSHSILLHKSHVFEEVHIGDGTDNQVMRLNYVAMKNLLKVEFTKPDDSVVTGSEYKEGTPTGDDTGFQVTYADNYTDIQWGDGTDGGKPKVDTNVKVTYYMHLTAPVFHSQADDDVDIVDADVIFLQRRVDRIDGGKTFAVFNELGAATVTAKVEASLDGTNFFQVGTNVIVPGNEGRGLVISGYYPYVRCKASTDMDDTPILVQLAYQPSTS